MEGKWNTFANHVERSTTWLLWNKDYHLLGAVLVAMSCLSTGPVVWNWILLFQCKCWPAANTGWYIIGHPRKGKFPLIGVYLSHNTRLISLVWCLQSACTSCSWNVVLLLNDCAAQLVGCCVLVSALPKQQRTLQWRVEPTNMIRHSKSGQNGALKNNSSLSINCETC